MRTVAWGAVSSHKIGSEHAIVVQLPAERFAGVIPPHHTPHLDGQGRYRIMLLAQDCQRCSFGDAEAGAVHELHVWLQLRSTTDDLPSIEGADVSLPPQQWLALFVATDNPVVEANLRSFGFDPGQLTGLELRSGGGSVALQDGAGLEWTEEGPGRGPARVGVHHALSMPGDGPDAPPHRIAALITDAVMGQPSELCVHGVPLEPFLGPGERVRALVHRMPALDAEIVWRRRPETS